MKRIQQKHLGFLFVAVFVCGLVIQTIPFNITPAALDGNEDDNEIFEIHDLTNPTASDTVISKDWEALETLESWWDENWQYRKKITIDEPSLMDREREPIDVYLEFTGNVAHENSIRLTYYSNDSTWYEVESQVYNVTLSGNYYVSCTLFFFLDLKKADTDVYYVYYDPVISTPASYNDYIGVVGVADIDDGVLNINNETNDNRRPEIVHANGTTAYTNTDSFRILYNGSVRMADVALIDTERGGSDWGGSSCGLMSAMYGTTDTLDRDGNQWLSIGEMALDAIGYDAANNVADGFSGSFRVNVGPDNPAEAWDGNGNVTILEDGPLFTKIKIQTTDGAFADIEGGTWYRDDQGLGLTDDNYNRYAGATGYVKYNITYTFYYYGNATFTKIDLDILADPQRGSLGSGYSIESSSYQDTNVYFKNYGDWPHLMQLVKATSGSAVQNRKSWYGSKYGLFDDPLTEDAKRRDYPLEPWTAWWDDAAGTDPGVGMFAITDGIGWEVLSLAVGGIGPNSILQQILPEGHQGSQYMLPRGSILNYDYFLLTSAHGDNDTKVRDMARRINLPVSIDVGEQESFSNNGLFIHINDIDGTTALGTYVKLSYSNGTVIYDQQVNSIGNVTYLKLPDDSYDLEVYYYTDSTFNQYTIAEDSFSLDHTTNRTTYITYNANIANLTFYVVNWARNSELLTGGLIRFRNISDNSIVEQNITWDGYEQFRLYTDGTTQYNIELLYGGQTRVTNITNPYTVTTSETLDIGVQVDTTAITIDNIDSSTVLGNNYSMQFYYHEPGNLSNLYQAETITVSSEFDTDYWTEGVDYDWWDAGGGLYGLNLTTGFSSRLNTSSVHAVYIHAENQTIETATEKLFVIVDPIGSSLVVTLDDETTNQIEVSRGATFHLEVDYLATNGTDLDAATVEYLLDGSTTAISYNITLGNYSTYIDTDTLNFGTHIITISASQQNFEEAVTSVVLVVIERPTIMSLTSSGTAFFGENFTINMELLEAENLTEIDTSLTRIEGNVQSAPSIWGNVTGANGNYQIEFDGIDFTSLGLYTLQINWTAPQLFPYYQSQNRTITIRIVERDSQLTYEPVGNVAYGENATIDLRYEDGLNGSGITAGIIETDVPTQLESELGNGDYRVIINTLDLGGSLGDNFVTISLNWTPTMEPYYENQSVTIKITILGRSTQLIADAPSATQYGEDTQFAIIYSDLLNDTNLAGAEVSISSSNTTISPSIQGDNSYLITLSTTQFASNGTYYIPISANWTGGVAPYYGNKSITVKLVVLQRTTQLTYESLSPTPYNENFTFFIDFVDGLNGTGIDGATVSSTIPIQWSTTGTAGRYSISINTTNVPSPGLGSDSVILILDAPTGNPYYADNQITLSLVTIERPTQLTYDSLSPTPVGEDVLFNINYEDANTGDGIFQNIVVSSSTSGIILNSNNLGNGVYEITLSDAGLLAVGSHPIVFNFNVSIDVAPYYSNNTITINVIIDNRQTQLTYSGLVPTS